MLGCRVRVACVSRARACLPPRTWWNVVFGGLVVILHFELEAEDTGVVATTYDYHLHKSKAGGDGK